MYTVNSHPDKKGFWHYHLGLNEDDSYFVLDENNELIPSEICICCAYKPSECMCGCTSWGLSDNYRYN